MPLVYQQNINEASRLAVWHITESEDFFLQKVPLSNNITHPHKRLQHLAGRYLLPELFEHFPLKLVQIADTKKPYLLDEAYHFSISHCADYAAAIVSKTNRVGVDIEVVSAKVEKIKNKFLSASEQEMLDALQSGSNNRLLTLAWSIKETIFKWYAEGGVDFREHMHIRSVSLNGNEFTAKCTLLKREPVQLTLHGLIFNNNALTWLVT